MANHLRQLAGAAAIGLLLCAGSVTAAGQQPDPAALEQYAREGERALAEGRYTEAEDKYESLRRMSPGTPEIHARLGLIYFQQGKFSDAVPALREALKLKPGLPKIDTLLAMSLSELGRYEEALKGLQAGFRQTGDSVLKRMAGLHLQRAYTGLARDREAVEVALELSRLHPDDPEVLYHSGRLFANFAYLQTMKLARVAPDSVWLHQAAGEANESQGLYDAAVREYRQVLALAPRRPGIHFRIGRALLARAQDASTAAADAAEALRAFEEELRVDPTNASAAYEIAELHRKAGDLAQARAFFERALSHYPDFDDALVGLGRTLVSLGQPEQALPRLEAAAKRDPDNEVAYYQLAQAYRALGRTADQEKALAEFTRLRTAQSDRAAIVPEPRRDVTKQQLDPKPPG
jgi:tetratricopeptide (TPR) repeat protein